MNEIFNIASHFIQGKPLFVPVRRLLNLLFNVSISSFLYVRYFGSYTWLSYSQYKEAIDFFIKGNFFIPFSIFLVVYAAIQTTGFLLFQLFTHLWSIKQQRKILEYKMDKSEIDEGLQKLSSISKYLTIEELSKEKLIEFYNLFKTELTQKDFLEMEKALKDPKNNLEANFIFTFRMLAAITIYFISLSEFTPLLYILVLITLLGISYFFIIAYRLLDIIPATILKLYTEAEKYVKEYNK
jgi:hypothetical protein